MKKIITLLFFIILYQLSYSQVWKNLDSVSSQVARAGCFSIDSIGYIFGGSYFGNAGKMWAYDTLTNNWAQVTSYPSDSTDGLISCALNGIGYAGTGAFCCYQFGNNFLKYDPKAGVGGTWTRLQNFPGGGRAYGVGFALDGKVYFGGGLYNTGGGSAGSYTRYSDFYCYDPVKNSWTPIANCPASGVSCDPVAFVVGDKAYVGCGGKISIYGQGLSIPQSDFWEYDTTSKAWTQISGIPGTRAESVAFSTCDFGYVGLGYTDSTRHYDDSDFWQYNPATDTWKKIASYGGGPRNAPEGFTIGKTGYVVGGAVPNGNQREDLWSYAAVVTPAFSADTSVCQGGSITFTDTSNFSPDHWYWQFPGGKPDTSSAKSVVVEYDTAGTYNVISSAWNACDSGTFIDSNYIIVNPGGVLTVVPSSPSISCGQSVALNVTNTGTNFKWEPSTGLNDTTGDTVMANPTITTVYSVTGASTGGCAFSGTDTVKVTPALLFTILPQDTGFCSSQSAILYVSGGGSEFIWIPTSGITDSTLSVSGDSVMVSPTVTTTYTVTGNNPSGCASSGTDMVTIIPSPNKPTFSQDGNVLTSSSKHDNQWYRNDTLLLDDTSQDLTITIPGEYWVVVNNEANGCSTSSDSAYVKLAGINQLSIISDQLSIYPNPFNDNVFIKINSSAENVKDWNLQVADVLGRTVFTKSSLNYSNDIDLSNFASGVYFITVINKTGSAVVPVVKQN